MAVRAQFENSNEYVFLPFSFEPFCSVDVGLHCVFGGGGVEQRDDEKD